MFRCLRFLSVLLAVTLLIGACAPAQVAPTIAAAPPTAISAPTVTVAPAESPTTAPTMVPTTAPTRAPAPVATPSVTPIASGFPVTVADAEGNKVTFDRAPQRIISLSQGHTETLYALGLGDRVIAADTYSDYPPEAKAKATLQAFPKPNAEEIIALQPDLIVTLVEGPDFTQQMAAREIKVLHLFPEDFAATLDTITVLGRVTGTEAKAKQITDDMRARAEAIAAKTKDAPKPRVLYEIDATEPTKPFVAGAGGYYGSLLPLAGGKNIFDDIDAPATQVSAEQIIARDPEIIILGDAQQPYNAQTPAMVKARNGWGGVAAVKNDRIIPIDNDLVSRPGPRLIDGLEALAKVIHPELLK